MSASVMLGDGQRTPPSLSGGGVALRRSGIVLNKPTTGGALLGTLDPKKIEGGSWIAVFISSIDLYIVFIYQNRIVVARRGTQGG